MIMSSSAHPPPVNSIQGATLGHRVSREDVGPAINVVNWFLTVTAFLAVTLRIITKGRIAQFSLDDLFIFVALFFSLGLCISDSLQVNYGLGQLDPAQQDIVGLEKSDYAANIFYVAVSVTSKLSVLLFFRYLSPVARHQKITRVLIWLTSVWGFVSFIVSIMQCRPPDIWMLLDKTRCLNRTYFWTFFNVFGILLEVALIAFPVNIVSKININRSRKILLITCFATRIGIIGALMVEVVERFDPSISPINVQNHASITISRRIASSLSIIIACVPYYLSWTTSAFRFNINTFESTRKDSTFHVGPARHESHCESSKSPRTQQAASTRELLDSGSQTESQTESQTQLDNALSITKTTAWHVQYEQSPHDGKDRDIMLETRSPMHV